MGTIIRTAAAIGCDRILLTKGSVNPWSSKVLRSSMGAHFNARIYDNLDISQISYFLAQSSHIFLADNKETELCMNSNELRNQEINKWKHVSLIIGIFVLCSIISVEN